MADYLINIFLDDEKRKQIEAAGLSDKIVEIGGKKAVQVVMSAKEQKKLAKGFPDLTFDASNACVLPAEAEFPVTAGDIHVGLVDVSLEAAIVLYPVRIEVLEFEDGVVTAAGTGLPGDVLAETIARAQFEGVTEHRVVGR